ncbi:hypothetical protein [Streptacidiphilus carbonis]|uniref:hypothetical protein n=1 Tax=Streptacidiphilus carbonis TaxID=105422 RepID=UPI0005A95499|nr:hypothetical protein [Streptacidiphilus carbonis]
MTAQRVTAQPDALWFRVALGISEQALRSTDWLDQLAAAFAEDPERIAAQLLALNELNEQTQASVDAGDDLAADHAGGHANAVRAALSEDLPLDLTVRLDEQEARDLSLDALVAARRLFSARVTAGVDPDRKALPLRSVA